MALNMKVILGGEESGFDFERTFIDDSSSGNDVMMSGGDTTN